MRGEECVCVEGEVRVGRKLEESVDCLKKFSFALGLFYFAM